MERQQRADRAAAAIAERAAAIADRAAAIADRKIKEAADGDTDSTGTVGENIIATIKMRNNFCYPIAILDFSLLLPI